MKFERYNIIQELKDNLARLEFKSPTDIQFKSIPHILKGEDVMAIAQTGTGKTAAFAIPIIHKISIRKRDSRDYGIKCLVMVPTRELADQINKVFIQLEKDTKVSTIAIYGGVDQESQIKKLNRGADILVATPGRMFDLINQGALSLDLIETLVLDEADQMLALGFYKDITDVLRKIPRRHQTLFFSATINEAIKDLAYSIVKNPIRIQISPKDRVNKNINHSVAFIEMDDKRFFLERIIKQNPESKIMVFVRTKVRAERVLKAMERVEIAAETLHGDKEQDDRTATLNRFRKNETKILIATDVSARGIDIDQIDYVINYDLPDIAENYVHRVGRTGRGNKKGVALSFCAPEERPMLDEIQEYLEKPVAVLDIDPTQYEQTIDLTSDTSKDDWKTLMKDALHLEDNPLPVKKKRKR